MELCRLILLCFTLNVVTCFSLPGREEEERKTLGERKFREILRMSESDQCWKNAVSQLKSRCKSLTDIEQSRLAVAFANCHLQKSGRKTYFCDNTMSIKDCTVDMNSLAFQTYTEFFTHTGHICYFLQNLLWQEKAENVIFELSEASSETVQKLQTSLEHHKVIEKKQNEVLDAFTTMKELAQKQRDLLWEVYSNLKISIESVRYITSLFLIELVGIETFVVAVASWVVIYFLPRFNYSMFWLNILLIAEQAVEIIIRRAYGKMVRETANDVTYLYKWIWVCRYFALCFGVGVYFFNWMNHSNPVQRNLLVLKEIQKDVKRLSNRVSGAVMESFRTNPTSRGAGGMRRDDKGNLRTVRGSFTKAISVHSEPPLSPSTDWRMTKYLKSLPPGLPNEHPLMEDIGSTDTEDNSDTTWKGSTSEFLTEQTPSRGDVSKHPSKASISIRTYPQDHEPETPMAPQSEVENNIEKDVSEEKSLHSIDNLKRRRPKNSQMRKSASGAPTLDPGVDINYFVESPEKLYRLLQTIPPHYLRPHLYNLRSTPGGYHLRPRSNNSS